MTSYFEIYMVPLWDAGHIDSNSNPQSHRCQRCCMFAAQSKSCQFDAGARRPTTSHKMSRAFGFNQQDMGVDMLLVSHGELHPAGRMLLTIGCKGSLGRS